MKRVFQISVMVFLFSLGASMISACSCVSDSLSKRFKKAQAIFVGKATDDEPENKSLIQNSSNTSKYVQILEVVKAWKGVKKEFIAIDFNTKNLGASCPTLYHFEDDKEYLVFAYWKELKVEMVCSDTTSISPEYNSTAQREIRQLNSFSFRFWSRLNLF
jgi:hypothetical protein